MRERKLWTDERQKLLDRVQAKDFIEFKKYETPKEPKQEKEDVKEIEYL